MEPSFWLESWEIGGSKTSFHRPDIHPYVIDYCSPEFLAGKRVFVPLCGKSNAMSWFQRHAEHVIGIELVEAGIVQYFENHPQPYIKRSNRYESEKLTIIQGDLFALTPQEVGPIDFVYDRASLIAFPLEMRRRYLDQLNALTPINSQTLLVTLEYSPILPEPPFSVGLADVQNYYGDNHQIQHLLAPVREGHGMQRKFKLDYVIEHGFMLTKQSEKGSRPANPPAVETSPKVGLAV